MTNPKLRFRGRNGESLPQMQVCTLGDVAQVKDGARVANIYWQDEGIPYVRACDFNDKFASVKLHLTKEKFEELQALTGSPEKGDVLFVTGGNKGLSSYKEDSSPVYVQGGAVLTVKTSHSEKLDGQFLHFYFQTEAAQAYMRKAAVGGTIKHFTIAPATKMPMLLPSKEEQKKIADFFSALDEKIVLAERKLTVLQNLKSGLMQKVFSQEIRFKRKDGSSFPDWIDVTVGDVAETCGGGTPFTGNEDFWGGDIQWLTPTEINSKYVHASKRTITDAGLKNSNAKLLPKEALVLTTRATVGACSINQFEGRVCTNQGFQSLICNAKVIPEFLYYVICSEKFQKAMLTNASGSTFLELSPKNLRKLPIEIPCLQEQRKIVAVLSELDKKIVVAEKHIDLLKLQKQAFMQQMFV